MSAHHVDIVRPFHADRSKAAGFVAASHGRATTRVPVRPFIYPLSFIRDKADQNTAFRQGRFRIAPDGRARAARHRRGAS